MWKLLVGFALFAALAIFVLTKSGGNIDMSGESHGIAAPHSEASAPADAASASASAAAVAASAVILPASAASQ